ncbi:unnamed protein product [Camellia sinensis]
MDDPAAATSDMIKQDKLSSCSQIQVEENLRIFACEMYISTGKYTVKGQKAEAPRRPKKSLKNGSNIAMIVVKITYAVLQTNRKRLLLKVPPNGMAMGYSLAMNPLCGHRLLLQLSTNPNIG